MASRELNGYGEDRNPTDSAQITRILGRFPWILQESHMNGNRFCGVPTEMETNICEIPMGIKKSRDSQVVMEMHISVMSDFCSSRGKKVHQQLLSNPIPTAMKSRAGPSIFRNYQWYIHHMYQWG